MTDQKKQSGNEYTPLPLQDGENLKAYFEREAEGKTDDQIIRIISMINAHLIRLSGLERYENLMKRMAREVVEFGDYFYETYGSDGPLVKKMRKQYRRDPFVLRMYQDCLSWLIDQRFIALKKELPDDLRNQYDDAASWFLDKCLLNRTDCEITAAVRMDGVEVRDIGFTFETELIESRYEDTLNTFVLAFYSCAETNSSLIVRQCGPAKKTVTVFVFDQGRPVSLSVSHMSRLYKAGGRLFGDVEFEEYRQQSAQTGSMS